MAKKRDISHLSPEEQLRIERQRERSRKHYELNRQRCIDRAVAWNKVNPDKSKARIKAWKVENKERSYRVEKDRRKKPEVVERISELRNINRQENRERLNDKARRDRANNPNLKLRGNLRHRVKQALGRNTKTGSAVRDLGCSVGELRSHLESQFRAGMSWDNYGRGPNNSPRTTYWEIDHIKPLASFDLTDRNQLLEACNYTNLQPLWHWENRAKSSKTVAVGVTILARNHSAAVTLEANDNQEEELANAC